MKLLDRIVACNLKIRGLKRLVTEPPGLEPLPSAAAIKSRSLTIHAGWLIDGSGGPVRRDVRIEIRNGLIQALDERMASSSEDPSSRAKPDLDLSACTLVPGLIDSHVHLAMTGSLDASLRAHLRAAPFEVIRRVILENLRDHLRTGVIAVRDGGGARGNAMRFSASAADRGEPVRVLTAGRGWHRSGRYGRLIGRPPAKGLDLAQGIRLDAERSDHIKIVNSGVNSLTTYGQQTAAQFDEAEMSAAVRAAAERGLSAMVHANGEAPVRIAVTSGCRSVEHGFFMGKDNLGRMADTGVIWVPTAVTMHAYARHYQQTVRNSDVARRTLDHQLEQLATARSLGVRVALGTDSGSPGVHHGSAVIEEMKLLMQAGYTLPEVIRCATANAAQLITAAHGLIAPGRPATFIVVAGKASALPKDFKKVSAVFIDGIRHFQSG